MSRLLLFVTFALFTVFAHGTEEIATEVNLVENIDEFLAENPDVKLIPLERSITPQQTKQFHYTLGRRVPGDRIVAQGNNNFYYQSPQDVEQKVWYPTNGVGKVVSFVEIWVDQTSNIGNAYILSGGIGLRNIAVVIQAKYTTLFNYRAAIYGY